MIVDLYRRAESGNKYSYLAVPAGKFLPEEVTGTDWLVHSRQWDTEQGASIPSLLADDVVRQIDEKRYAITHLSDQIRS